MTTNTDPSALVSQYFAANPTATPAQVAQAVQSIGGLTSGLTSALAQHYGTTGDVIGSQYSALTAPPVANAGTTSATSTPAVVGSTAPQGNIQATGSTPPTGLAGFSQWYAANPNANNALIGEAVNQFGISTDQAAGVTGVDSKTARENYLSTSQLVSQNPQLQVGGSAILKGGQLQTSTDPDTGATIYTLNGVNVTPMGNGVYAYQAGNPTRGGTDTVAFTTDANGNVVVPKDISANYSWTRGSSGSVLGGFGNFIAPVVDLALAATGNGEFIPLVSGANTYAQTGNLGKALTSAALSEGAITAAPYVGNAVSSATSDTLGSTASKVLGGATSALTGAEISSQGKADPLTALVGGGISAAVPIIGSQIPGYSSLSAAQQAAVNKVIGGTLTGQTASQTAINAAIAAGAQEVKSQIGSTSSTSNTSTGSTSTGGTTGVATVNAGTNTGGSEVIDPNSVTNAATVASSAKPGADSEQFGQHTSSTDTGLGKSMFDMPVNQIDASKLSADNPIVSTDPNTGIKQSLFLDEDGNVTKTVNDPVLNTTETTTVNSDGSYEVVNYDKVTGLQTTDKYDADGNLLSSNSEEFGAGSDLKPVTVTGSSGTYTGDLSTLPSVKLSDGTVAHVDLTNTGGGTVITPGGGGTVITPGGKPTVITPGGGGGGVGGGGGGGGGGGSATQTTKTTPATTTVPTTQQPQYGAAYPGAVENVLRSYLLNQPFKNPLAKLEDIVNASQASNEKSSPLQTKSEQPVNYYNYGQPPLSVADQLATKNVEGQSVDESAKASEPAFKKGGYVAPIGALPGPGGRQSFKHGAHVAGKGDGQSDDIPAWLADGEFVFPADVVSALGNGSTKAGTDKLYKMMEEIRARARSAKVDDLPPPALKSPLDYLKGKK